MTRAQRSTEHSRGAAASIERLNPLPHGAPPNAAVPWPPRQSGTDAMQYRHLPRHYYNLPKGSDLSTACHRMPPYHGRLVRVTTDIYIYKL